MVSMGSGDEYSRGPMGCQESQMGGYTVVSSVRVTYTHADQ